MPPKCILRDSSRTLDTGTGVRRRLAATKDGAKRLVTSRRTSFSFHEEWSAIFPVRPASVSWARFSPLGMGIGLQISFTGGRQITFLL